MIPCNRFFAPQHIPVFCARPHTTNEKASRVNLWVGITDYDWFSSRFERVCGGGELLATFCSAGLSGSPIWWHVPCSATFRKFIGGGGGFFVKYYHSFESSLGRIW